MFRLLLSRVVVLTLVACVGCGGGDGTYPVSGTIQTVDGVVVAPANVMFYSSDGKTYATTANANGAFTVRSAPEAAGLAPGKYQVVVQEVALDDIDAAVEPKVDAKYRSRNTTDLEVTVAEEENVIDLKLDPPNSRSGRRRR